MQELRRPVEGIEEHAAQHNRTDGMQPVLEGGDDPEVSAAASQAPEEVLVLRLTRFKEPDIGCDDVGRDEIVTGQPVLPLELAAAAAQREARDAGVGDAPASAASPNA